MMVGAMHSTLDWHNISMSSISDDYFALFERFVAEALFERKCRILLDLFKLQIVYAGMLCE
jgi:hypothetical protein